MRGRDLAEREETGRPDMTRVRVVVVTEVGVDVTVTFFELEDRVWCCTTVVVLR